jgi:hypothetical protein
MIRTSKNVDFGNETKESFDRLLFPRMPGEFMLGWCHRKFDWRPLDWRWKAAKGLQQVEQIEWEHYDPHVAAAYRLIKKALACAPSEQERFWSRRRPITEALELAEYSGLERCLLESWLLSGAPLERIARETGYSVKTIQWYSTYLFDISNRSKASVRKVVIRRESPASPPDPWKVQRLKADALKHGPDVLNDFASVLARVLP